MISEYLKNDILITDGAMGTYYSKITGNNESFCEFENLNKVDIVKRIHKEYIEAGAKLLRTNTFSANTITLQVSRDKVKEIIKKGYNIAKEAAEDKDVFVAADIGPINLSGTDKTLEDVFDEYKFIIDVFMSEGADIFIFETLSNLNCLKEISEYIKKKNSSAFILTQFAVMQDGYTRDGISISNIVSKIKDIKDIDAFGFNCGSGPTHLYNLLKQFDLYANNIISVLPNAGYPEIINERMVYVDNPDYFSDRMLLLKNLGPRILGGCCGTTPEHIRRLSYKIKSNNTNIVSNDFDKKLKIKKPKKVINKFIDKLYAGEFPIVVELDPPTNTTIDKLMHCAEVCRDNNIDLVTVADSPMSKVRVDSVVIASKIKREIGIDVMPHICCRDKNVNAIRSSLLAANIEDIRNVLAVTGDPVTGIEGVKAKSVFNLNSFRLIELISEMNGEVFKDDEISIGGALNLNVTNKNSEVLRMNKKVQNGASFFLTQPIFEDETIEFLAQFKREKNIKILGGIMPLVSYRNAQFINNELSGVNIPEKYANRFNADMSREEAERVGIDIAIDIIKRIKNHVDGLYFVTPFNRIEMIISIIKAISK
ncbi:bifunctional homocysteine S-methyltransferase/methylenetetrahydrofolate reductase [Clostridium hydrogenum]|uniref:bifunctional homocysteine S-methyltransferase/methylenetetrahydrofolate reductase n=1 Tax=Clostridium hydrogenum TaxID=2855764 RepID=UPI002E30BA4E|nr:bifunctional homocysteine S-methyltransferase/methylenetetrahydrofolate reductase [Clostridium hydrogenum]